MLRNKHKIPQAQSSVLARNSFHSRIAEIQQQRAQRDNQNSGAGLNIRRPENEPPVVRGIRLIPTTSLHDMQKTVFSFPIFNAVQSQCFTCAYESDDNLVVSAPTGSGKTVVMELGILRILPQIRSGSVKVVYQAPTKSLCSERYRDWQAKFSVFDVQCAELTGDTDASTLRSVANAGIIITTPEKWDSVTRKWKDHAKLMDMIRLFLIDEVHILRDSRGATLEAIVSRMKSAGSKIRFMALSATIPNSEDIAAWLTRGEHARYLPAQRELFDDSFRPVQLKKHILGHEGPYNPWAFDAAMTERIPDVIARYGKRKPVMVFCPTKESTIKTANRLVDSWQHTASGIRAWSAPRHAIQVENEQLQKVVASGVAFHNASLSIQDRHAVERGYLNGEIMIICSTSTLAVGINLPCYLVILKGTQAYSDAGLQEYSSLEVMQMLGRAGRPQHETEACAVVLCLNERVKKYEKMVAGEEVLESSLHQNLIEHLNAEIGIGTITSISTAKQWLSSTFLNIRLKQNPKYYDVDMNNEVNDLDNVLLKCCEKDLALLKDAQFIEDNGRLRSTEYGQAMARYCTKFETMKSFMNLPVKAKVSQILSTLVQAFELKDFRLKHNEKAFYKELNQANEIRYPVKVDVALTEHKVSILIQARLGSAPIGKNPKNKFTGSQVRQLQLDTNGVIAHARRLIRCMVDMLIQRGDSIGVKSALELARSIAAGVWDDTAMQLKQIPGIGDVSMRKLAAANIKSIDTLFNTEPSRIEVVMSKHAPFGNELHQKAAEFPMLHISAQAIEKKYKPSKGTEVKLRCQIGFLNQVIPMKFNRRPYSVLFICETSHGELVDFRRFSPARLEQTEEILLTVLVKQTGTKVRCHTMCDDLAGTHRIAEFEVECSQRSFLEKPPIDISSKGLGVLTNPTQVLDEFESDGLNDSDLLAIAFEPGFNTDVLDIDEILDDQEERETPAGSKKRSAPSIRESDQWREPRELPNGNWTCQHACADEAKDCKHKCCKEGVKKPMKPSTKRQRKEREQETRRVGDKSKREESSKRKQVDKQGPLDRLLGVSKTQPESGQIITSKRTQQSTDDFHKLSQTSTDVLDAVRDVKSVLPGSSDFDECDWQAIDELVVQLDKRNTTHKVRSEPKLPNAFATSELDTIPRKDSLNSSSHSFGFEEGLFLTQSNDPTKDTDLNWSNNQQDFIPTDTVSPKATTKTTLKHEVPTWTSTSTLVNSSDAKTDTGQKWVLAQSSIDQIEYGVDGKETEDESKRRQYVENQKAKWAEIDYHEFLNYDNFGQYVEIIDAP